ncbi:MAG: flagellar hook-associated protein FlgK [Firmicutes bacterium]|nr:flagellar hook-associated protein FlgK [Bacillota bacterium]
MRSTFFGLEIGRLGLQAHQKQLEITSHNMANASTPGYSRQRGEMTTTQPFTYPAFNRVQTAGQLGTGVEVTAVMRIRDELIDEQIWAETSLSGYWESRKTMLDEMELIVNEPSDANIRTAIDNFWKAIQGVANNATSEPARSVLRQETITMTELIRQDYQRMKSLRSIANERIKEQVNHVNTIAGKIALLNDQISKVTMMNDHANDLMDQRDALIEELSGIIKISKTTDKFNRVNITINGIALVQGITANKIILEPNHDDEGMVRLKWERLDKEVTVLGGSLRGLLEMRDQDLPEFLNHLDNFAKTLITEVNKLHRTGYGLDESRGIDFFKGTGAADIDLADAIKDVENGLNRIAASSELVNTEKELPGNNEIMLEISRLFDKRLLNNSNATMGEYIGAVIADLGEKTSAAKVKYEGQVRLIANLDERRESVCGVNLDEEMTNMIRFQHGYNAAAKIIATMDQMLDVIVNRLKLY